MLYPWRVAMAGVLAAGLSAQTVHPGLPANAAGGQKASTQASTEAPSRAPAIVQLRVLEGDGAVHTIGSRSSQPILLFLSDEMGRPVEGASVSARLPEDGPSGVFSTGLRTEVMITGPDGRSSLRGISWNRLAGQTQIRITANKGEARAGIITTQYLTEPASARRVTDKAGPVRAPAHIDSSSRGKWALIAVLIGGAAAGGVAAAARGGSGRSTPAAPAVIVAPPAVTAPTLTIGLPSITIGGKP